VAAAGKPRVFPQAIDEAFNGEDLEHQQILKNFSLKINDFQQATVYHALE